MAADPHATWLKVVQGGQGGSPASAPGPHLRLVPPPPGGPPPPGLQAMRSLGRLSVYLVPTAILVAQAWANERGIAQAATNWTAIGSSLDDGMKQKIPDVKKMLAKSWQGADQEAAEAALSRLSEEIGKLRKSFADIGSVTDEVGGAIRQFWLEIAILSAALGGTLVAAAVMKLWPHLRAAATLREVMAAKLARSTSALLLAQLGAMVGIAAKTVVIEARKARQLGVVFPTGGVAVDFDQVRIKTAGLPPFQRPDVAGELPPGGAGHEWIAPRRELAGPPP